ncbi:MAG TPA: hypothetical protein VFM66_10310, partial [Agromyces sp.]|nr:hypothetical protein [Agromyces sp.]
PLSAATARPAAAVSATSRVLRLFIFEPLESFDHDVESDLDVLNIRPFGFGVKCNKYWRVQSSSTRDPPRVDP